MTDKKGKVHKFGPYKNSTRQYKDGGKIIKFWKNESKKMVDALGQPFVS